MNESARAALIELLGVLRGAGYQFVTPTPATHARVIARADKKSGRNLRDVFGWNVPFTHSALESHSAILDLLAKADALEERDGLLRSRLRVSSGGDNLFLHSAFPTTQHDAVFFGPDSYRFVDFVAAELPNVGPIGRLADIGCGTGVGAIMAAQATNLHALVLSDINQRAVDLAEVNSAGAAAAVEIRRTNALDGVDGMIDCIIANPPYIADPAHRAYRDGGDMHGGELSVRWAKLAAERLERGGAFLLYTGSAIIGGEDLLKAALFEALAGFDLRYREIDPDVFGEELEREDYADVDRIAAVGLVAVKL
ncbi:MAG: methyltransferase [Hyphomonadaceae bacterium]|nr:methyltransferase [Hyphomonadaceae bacterium]